MKNYIAVLLLALFTVGCASLDLSPRQEERAAQTKWAIEHQNENL